MDEIKAMLESLVQGCLKARNEDEKTDKRKLIDEVGGILKDKVDEEVWRTVIGKIEKLAYEKSEAGTADNKAKNEDEKKEEIKEEKKEEKKEVKEDKEEDTKAENEEDEEEKECLYSEFKEKIEKEAENGCKKAKNSNDEFKKEFYSGQAKKTTSYMSQAAGIELGKELY